MTIAITLSGLSRTYKKSLPSFHKNILLANKKHDLDIYITVWDHTHERVEGAEKPNEYAININKLPKNILKDVVESYSPKRHCIMDQYHEKNSFFTEHAKKLIKVVGTPNHPQPNLLIHSVIAQSYVWHRVFDLIDSNCDYDLIIKSRFDLDYKEPIVFDNFDINKVNCFGLAHQNFGVGDIVFGSNYKIMKKLMYQYHLDVLACDLRKTQDNHPNVFAEYILKDYIQQNNYDINCVSNNLLSIIRE